MEVSGGLACVNRRRPRTVHDRAGDRVLLEFSMTW